REATSRRSACIPRATQAPLVHAVLPMTPGEERADKLMGQLHEWAMEAVELPRTGREAFIRQVAAHYYDDAIRNGLSVSQAEEWRESVSDWLHSLVEVIETSGGAGGGHA